MTLQSEAISPHSVSTTDRSVLRDLATRVVEISAQPVMTHRKNLWKRHNSLERVKPMVLVFPEGSWRELILDESLVCQGEQARSMELELRKRLYTHEHFADDTVIEPEWVVNTVVTNTGWGLEARHKPSDQATGAWGFDPVIATESDLERLQFPLVTVDKAATLARLETAEEVFGDILDVQARGIGHVSFHLMAVYTRLRGLQQVFMDMIENPAMLHSAMALLESGSWSLIEQYEDLGLLSLNNDGTYHSSGGVGYTDELPLPNYDPDHIRPRDIWASAESQEMDPVSPEMHEEFVMQYERRLLGAFGLNGYGCCDDLSQKLEYVLKIPNIRRISIAPWADVPTCADKLNGDYVFSWKPKPTYLVGSFDETAVERYIRETLKATPNCVIEMILKDTHTCENQPERFARWTEIASRLAQEYAN